MTSNPERLYSGAEQMIVMWLSAFHDDGSQGGGASAGSSTEGGGGARCPLSGRSAAATSAFAQKPAWSSGISPSRSVLSGFAPCHSSSSAIATLPALAAKCSGDHTFSVSSGLFGSTPRSSSDAAVARSSASTAARSPPPV